MKAIKQITATTIAIFACMNFATAAGWTTNLDSALSSAKKNKKFVLAQFTGSDWCPPCMMIHDKVFSKSSFTGPASKKFILVKIDMPKANKSLTLKNRKVMRDYKVTGVPTVLLFGDDGREFSRFGAAQYPTVDGFLDKLREELKKKDMD
jgi:thiol:disulfide interchange protein